MVDKNEADYYVVQTKDETLAEKINVSTSKIHVVSNGIGSQYMYK